MRKFLYIVLCALSLTGCEFIRKYQLGEAMVKVSDAVLYEQDLLRVSEGLSPEDSARVVSAYIEQWATEELVYSSARRHSDHKDEIEHMVDDYRRSLYVNDWEASLVEERMPKQVNADSIAAFYELHKDRFVLREALVKGVFIVIPKDATDQKLLKLWLEDLSDENKELTEKYVYQYATGYEFFADEWQPESKLLIRMPLEHNELSGRLQKDKLIEYSDSASVYLLRVVDKRMAGEVMPLEYASKTIEHLLLERRQKEFIGRQRKEMYRTALRRGQVIIKKSEI